MRATSQLIVEQAVSGSPRRAPAKGNTYPRVFRIGCIIYFDNVNVFFRLEPRAGPR